MSEESIGSSEDSVKSTEVNISEQGQTDDKQTVSDSQELSPEKVDEEVDKKTSKSWQDDKRFEQFWEKNPEKLYDSYRSMEKKLEANGLKIKELERLTESSAASNEVVSYLESMQKHPEYSQKFSDLINEYNKSIRREAYGADLPDHIVEKLQEVDNLKEYIEKQKETEKVTEQIKIIEEQQAEIDKIAKENNLEYDKNEFLEWCSQNKIPPSAMKVYFVDQALPAIKGLVKSKTQGIIIKNLKTNKQAALPSLKEKKQSDNADMPFRQKLLNALS